MKNKFFRKKIKKIKKIKKTKIMPLKFKIMKKNKKTNN